MRRQPKSETTKDVQLLKSPAHGPAVARPVGEWAARNQHDVGVPEDALHGLALGDDRSAVAVRPARSECRCPASVRSPLSVCRSIARSGEGRAAPSARSSPRRRPPSTCLRKQRRPRRTELHDGGPCGRGRVRDHSGGLYGTKRVGSDRGGVRPLPAPSDAKEGSNIVLRHPKACCVTLYSPSQEVNEFTNTAPTRGTVV